MRALYVLGPAMAVAVSVAGYQMVGLPVDEQGPHGAFLDAAGVLLGVLMIVAMSSKRRAFRHIQAAQRRKLWNARCGWGCRGCWGL